MRIGTGVGIVSMELGEKGGKKRGGVLGLVVIKEGGRGSMERVNLVRER